jgi:hypothetical protein
MATEIHGITASKRKLLRIFIKMKYNIYCSSRIYIHPDQFSKDKKSLKLA